LINNVGIGGQIGADAANGKGHFAAAVAFLGRGAYIPLR
jgi:hypothetical protein